MNDVRVRFAPSPTGNLHLGGARTALYNYLFARQHGGTYLLRIEDTDRERSTPESEAQILRTLDWIGLGPDDNSIIVRQSERGPRYQEVIEQLREAGALYYGDDEPDASGRKPLRLRVEGEIVFEDLIHGQMLFQGDNVRDPIVVRSDGTATYNLAAAIDDHDMGITHVIRGNDHLSNTNAQVVIHRALSTDGNAPVYAHLPMILGPDGKRLSKRHGAASVEDYMDYIPDAVVNYLALLGWGPGNDQQLFSRDELIETFELHKVGSAPAQFDPKLLDHIQKQHVLNMSKEEWIAT